MTDMVLETRVLSSLSKVFADEELKELEWNSGSMFCNETYSYQVAYKWNGALQKNNSVKVISDISDIITIRAVGLVTSEMPCYLNHDENVLRTTPGLYPDVLMDIASTGINLLPNQWRSIWVTIDGSEKLRPGSYTIKLAYYNQAGEELAAADFSIKVINAMLPKQSLIHTEWFHSDCLATWYNVEVFSEEHWSIIEKYIKTAVKHGINMILTPVFTPPLDTEIGGERPTVQLVEVTKIGEVYTFNFDKLKRWVDLCLNAGVSYFEISHLFTQWGASHAPKIMATEEGEIKKIFGWDTDAAGEEYRNFIVQFLPRLVEFIKENELDNSCYFHVSDEPSMVHFENYKKAAELLNINEYIKGFPVIDALSNYEFYEKGIVKNPIPASNHIDKFLENKVPNLWTYYCCSQYQEVSNRFMHMPSARNRIIGIQLYKFNIKGFLHWGYNFWYSGRSLYPIDPYKVTDGAQWFPSGDPFVVYPGKEGPVESIRLEVFFEALQDLRTLNLLESLIGRQKVIDFLEEDVENPITFNIYPKDEKWLLQKREKLNRLIESELVVNR